MASRMLAPSTPSSIQSTLGGVAQSSAGWSAARPSTSEANEAEEQGLGHGDARQSSKRQHQQMWPQPSAQPPQEGEEARRQGEIGAVG